jgi:hypothetical protein
MINTLEKSTHSAKCINHYPLINFQFSSGTFLFICLAGSRGDETTEWDDNAGAETGRSSVAAGCDRLYRRSDIPGRREYTFTVDMVPDYVFQGTQTGRFCIYSQRVTNRAVWDGLMASQATVPFSISISDTGTFASISSFFAQRTLFESFSAAGAFDCGPAPNVRF